MRLIIWLAAPVAVLAGVAVVTIMQSWVDGTNVCHTWLSMILLYCG